MYSSAKRSHFLLTHRIIHVPVDTSCSNKYFCELAINYDKEKQPQNSDSKARVMLYSNIFLEVWQLPWYEQKCANERCERH